MNVLKDQIFYMDQTYPKKVKFSSILNLLLLPILKKYGELGEQVMPLKLKNREIPVELSREFNDLEMAKVEGESILSIAHFDQAVETSEKRYEKAYKHDKV